MLAIVEREAGALPHAARALLEGAAVVGDPSDPELAATAAGVEADALDRLVHAGFVRHAAAPRGPLTDRERDIAALVARGHTNKQVAASLYLSEKTVANTLTRIYVKLGVRSRAQLAYRSR